MNITINPFQQLYLSDDTPTENSFVQLFSAEVLQTAIHPVFQGNNVVLSGPQGCGKTMILNLLRPEMRIAYWDAGKADAFPVPQELRTFISAGINLTRSGITDLVQVTLDRGEDADARELPLYFADFFNYLVVEDIIQSVEKIGSRPEVFDSMVKPSFATQFARAVASEDCWFGALEGVQSMPELKARISDRVSFYRHWVNGNLQEREPPDSIRRSKTNIGEPISRTADCLRQCGMIAAEVPVLIRVDQIEEMHRAFTERQRVLLLSFRKMLNRVFYSRDARVHYRAGTRRYGWDNPEFLGVWGSEARLEIRRNYHRIEMDDELFVRGEKPNTIFEKFAIDAFQKRIAYYFQAVSRELRPELAKSVFGKHPLAKDRLYQLNENATDAQIDRALGLDVAADRDGWSDKWRELLRQIYRTGHAGMLDAALAAAWGRQTGSANSKRQHRESPPPIDEPWKERPWWRKERMDIAVLQLMTRNQQRFMWWGYKDVCSLSGGNITVFLHICHRIWDGFLKNESSLPEEKRTELLKGGTIDKNIQAAGILFASNEWFKKLPEEPGGNARQSFVEKLGMRLNADMMNDLSMSYPGGNGISVQLSQFKSEDDEVTLLRNFIQEAIGYGALFASEHSSKSKQGGRRMKFYLNPILCPRFQLPEAKTKEPYYWSMEELFALVKKAQVTLSRAQRTRPKQPEQHPLLPGFPDSKP